MPQLPIGDIGPCEVTWDYGGATPVIITPHLGKVTVRMADSVTDVHIDGQGVAPIEAFFEGATVELEVPMARSTLSQLANTIGYRDLGTLVGNTLTLHNVVGIEMMAHAKAIVIKPMCDETPDPDPHTWLLFYKCHPYRDFELGYDRNGQRVHMVKFKIFPNQDTGYQGDYFQEGLVSWREEFEDDFCDALGVEWTTDSLDVNKTITVNASPTCTVTIAAANSVDARIWCGAGNLAPKMFMPLGVIGPCKITTKLLSFDGDPPGDANLNTMAGILIATDPTGSSVSTLSRKMYLYGRFKDGGFTTFRIQNECKSRDAMHDCGGGGCLPRWLQIRIDVDQVITFWDSIDGSTWTQYLHGAAPFTIPNVLASPDPAYDIPNCYVGLFAKNTAAGVNFSATFDFFKIERYA